MDSIRVSIAANPLIDLSSGYSGSFKVRQAVGFHPAGEVVVDNLDILVPLLGGG